MNANLTTFIRESIDKQKQRIKEITDVHNFVLNQEVANAINEIKKLQNECPHEFHNKQCIFCDKVEK